MLMSLTQLFSNLTTHSNSLGMENKQYWYLGHCIRDANLGGLEWAKDIGMFQMQYYFPIIIDINFPLLLSEKQLSQPFTRAET